MTIDSSPTKTMSASANASGWSLRTLPGRSGGNGDIDSATSAISTDGRSSKTFTSTVAMAGMMTNIAIRERRSRPGCFRR